MNYNQIIKKIEKHMEKVGKERDDLDDFIVEIQQLKECCDEAYEALDTARDALSLLV